MNICPVMSMYATELDCLRARDKWFMERVAELERENEALRKDAERYRWLRDCGQHWGQLHVLFDRREPAEWDVEIDSTRAAIDAALKKETDNA